MSLQTIESATSPTLDLSALFGDVYLDIETQRGFDEVPGGWDNPDGFRFACAVTICGCHEGDGQARRWIADRDATAEQLRQEVVELVTFLAQHPRVVTHNGLRFDYGVLRAYVPTVYEQLAHKSLDTAKFLYDKIHRRVSLHDLAMGTIGRGKTGSGADAPRLWRNGDMDTLIAYCENDTRLLKDVVEHARYLGYVVPQQVQITW